MARNVKLQVFVTPEFYLKLAQEARTYNIHARSDSDLIQNLINYYQKQAINNEIEINKMQDRILAFNRVIQEKEAAIHAYANKKKKVKK
jgi:hypothetical protein